jgi:CelD/BcsL family acetyltransferase involved in cellulose biosynthesis
VRTDEHPNVEPAVTDREQLRALEPEWRRLAELRGNAFLTPEWFHCWHRHYGEGTVPFVPIVRDREGTLRGLLPLVVSTSGHPRSFRLAGANVGDYFHPVARQQDEAMVGAAAGEAVAAGEHAWSVLDFGRVAEGSHWVTRLVDGIGARLHRFEGPECLLPVLDLGRYGGWEDYLSSRSKNLRSQIRRRTRNLARHHAVRFRFSETVSDLAADMKNFFRLHDLRFGRQSSLRGERVRTFHRDFASTALERGWLRLSFIEVEGLPIAAYYGWRIGDRQAYFNSGFDPAYGHLSPGIVLQAMAIEHAFEEGVREYDFLLGDESYKLRLADRSREVHTVTLTKVGHPAEMLVGTEHGMRRLGRALPASARRRLGAQRIARARS